MYKLQQLRFSNQQTHGSVKIGRNSIKNLESANMDNTNGIIMQNSINNSSDLLKENSNMRYLLNNEKTVLGNDSTLFNLINGVSKISSDRVSYLFCNLPNHEMNQLNMVCLHEECSQRGLLCCMCLDEHSKHMKHCIAFQKVIQQLKETNSKTVDSHDIDTAIPYLTSINEDYQHIHNQIEQFRITVNNYLSNLKCTFQTSQQDCNEKINSLGSNLGLDMKEFFEKIEMNSIINESLHTNPSSTLKGDINSFLWKIEMEEESKTVRIKPDFLQEKLGQKMAASIKKQRKTLTTLFQKYIQQLNASLSDKYTTLTSLSRSSLQESQENYHHNQAITSSAKSRKFNKLLEKDTQKFAKFNDKKPTLIPCLESSETNSEKQNLNCSIILSTPSEDHVKTNDFCCLSFQDKQAFTQHPISQKISKYNKLIYEQTIKLIQGSNEFNLSDFMTQSKKDSEGNTDSINSCQNTFGKGALESDMDEEQEEIRSTKFAISSKLLHRKRFIFGNKNQVRLNIHELNESRSKKDQTNIQKRSYQFDSDDDLEEEYEYYHSESNNNSKQECSPSRQSDTFSKYEYSSTKRWNDYVTPQIMSFQMPESIQGEELMTFDPKKTQGNLNSTAESPKFTGNSTTNNQITRLDNSQDTYNKLTSPNSKKTCNQPNQCNNLSPTSISIFSLDNSPSKRFTRSSTKKQSIRFEDNNLSDIENNDQQMREISISNRLKHESCNLNNISPNKTMLIEEKQLENNLNCSESKGKSRKMKRSSGSRPILEKVKQEHNSACEKQ